MYDYNVVCITRELKRKIIMIVWFRHEAIMLINLSIMLLSSAQKITYYAFEKYPLFSLILAIFRGVPILPAKKMEK